ncbi:type IV secretion protein Rhs [Prauserella coralliicola]|nr:type IV secretion protein Rhs [Prauserella coralliicola]
MPGYADVEDPGALLAQDPGLEGGSSIEDAIADAGFQVQAVNWVWEKVVGEDLVSSIITPITGDFEQIAKGAAQWNNVRDALQAVRNNLNGGLEELRPSWSGEAADAFYDLIGTTWTLGIEADAQAAKLIGIALSKVADGSKRACDQILSLIEKLVNKLIEAAAMLPIPVVGWGRAVKLVYDGIQLYNAIMNLIQGIQQIIEGAQQVIQGIIGVGTALSKLGSANSVNDLLNVANEAGQGIADVREGASSVRDGATQASSAVSDARTSASSAADNARGLADERASARTDSSATSGTDTSGTTGTTNGTDSGTGNRPPADGQSDSRPSDPEQTRTPEDFRVCENDPVDIASGEVVLGQTDVQLPGVLPLILKRTHISSYRAGRTFGPNWASTLDQRLEFDRDGVVFVAEDGMILTYPRPAVGERVLPHTGPQWPLEATGNGFTVTPRGPGRVLHFATARSATLALTAVVDRNGNRIEIVRDDTGGVTDIRHSGGYHIAVTTESGRATELRLRAPNTADVPLMRYGYDEQGLLTDVVNSSGRPLRFAYDGEGRLTQWTDRNGEWYRYLYDSEGRCIANQGSGGFLNGTFAYDRGSRTTRFTDALGHTTTYRLNERNNVTARTNPLGHTTTSEWDDHDRLLSRTDPLGRTTTYSYDADGNLTTITRADGSQAHAEYNELGQPTTVVDPDGATWRNEYDERGNLVAVTGPDGATRQHTYNEQGHLIRTVDEAGGTRTVRTNAAGLPLVVTDPMGAALQHIRDQFGRIAETIDPVGGRNRFNWSIEGKVLARTDAGGAIESWRYDGEGNNVEYVDALGQATRFQTTHFDLPKRQTLPDGSWVEFGYDANLRTTSVTTSSGLVWRYEYDGAGNLVEETDFDGRTLSYEYDAANQLTSRTNGAGEVTRFTYDVLGNVQRRDAEGSVSRFEFDPAGRLVRAANDDADVVIERDPAGRVVAETVNGRTISYGYDAAGRRTMRRTPTGSVATWRYDANHRPVELRTAGRTITFGYDPAGRETERIVDDTTVLAQSWEPGYRLAAQTISAVAPAPAPAGGRAARVIQERKFHYRADGQVTAVDDRLTGTRRFDFDPVGRITGVAAARWRERYAYDALGNIVDAALPGADTSGPRRHTGTLVQEAGNVSYRYDAQGRLVSRQKKRLSRKPGTWRYSWNAEDRLVGVVTPDGTRWRYRYDPLGRRVAKERLDADGAVAERIDFTWDGTVLAEQTGSDGSATAWDWAPGSFRPLTQIARSRASAAAQEWIDERFYSIVTDIAGTPTELVGSDGALAWHSAGSVWGDALTRVAGSAETPLRFPGQYHDPESGLNYNFQRHYDPETGRYVSNDPLGLAPAINPSGYVRNPTVWLDPWGLAACNTYHNTRQEALDAAYDRAGIPRGTEPDAVWEVGNDHNRYGEQNYRHSEDLGTHGRYMQFETENGSRVIAEHTSDPNAPGPHFHAGQPKIDPTREAVDFGWSDQPNSQIERYSQIGGSHHIFYGVAPPS